MKKKRKIRAVTPLANAKSRVDVGDRQRDYRTENIHTSNRFVMVLAMLRYVYGFFLSFFVFRSTCTTSS